MKKQEKNLVFGIFDPSDGAIWTSFTVIIEKTENYDVHSDH